MRSHDLAVGFETFHEGIVTKEEWYSQCEQLICLNAAGADRMSMVLIPSENRQRSHPLQWMVVSWFSLPMFHLKNAVSVFKISSFQILFGSSTPKFHQSHQGTTRLMFFTVEYNAGCTVKNHQLRHPEPWCRFRYRFSLLIIKGHCTLHIWLGSNQKGLGCLWNNPCGGEMPNMTERL
jgi:hypothetical protein